MERSIRKLVAVFVGLTLFGASGAWAQQRGPISKKLLVGNWAYVKAESVAKDGTKHLGLLKAIHFADGHTVVFGSAADSEGKN